MKKKLRLSFILIVFSLIFTNFALYADSIVRTPQTRINFGSRNSALKFSENTWFNVGTADEGLVIDGTIVKDGDADITGNRIKFFDGVLESEGSEALMRSIFQPIYGEPDIIWLNGNSYLDGEPGLVIQKVYIDGADNRLEGQPIFNDSITYYDMRTSLSIALQSKLNQDIELNGGLLTLVGDLRIADNKFLVGPGTIRLNDRQCKLGAYFSNSWSTSLNWVGATDLVLTGSTQLTGEWIFTGENRLNGNGNVLDLTYGGTIRIAAGSSLHMTDVHIRGLGNSYNSVDRSRWYGKIVFDGTDSKLTSFNSDFELINDFDFNQGLFYVEGPTTFILKDNDWTFAGNSLLTVDGVSLWLDTLDDSDWPNPGQLNAPLPVYAGHYWQTENVRYDLLYGNLDLINSGTIREVCDRSQCWSSISSALTSEHLTTTLFLDQSVHIHPLERITIGTEGYGGNLTIDGQGAELVFSNASKSQFLVNPGWTVNLRNVELDRINAKTFDIKWNWSNSGGGNYILTEGRINIGENVVFGLSEDVTFSQGLIHILSMAERRQLAINLGEYPKPVVFDSIRDVAEPVVFGVRGVDGKKRLIFNPSTISVPGVGGTSGSTKLSYKDIIGTVLKPAGRVNATEYSFNDNDGLHKQNLKDEVVLLRLNENTMKVQAINLVGLEHITKTVSGIYTGAVGLGGQADVDVGNLELRLTTNQTQQGGVVSQEKEPMVFVVDGLDNKLRLLRDDIKFTGQLLFADQGDNELFCDFLLTQRINDPSDAGRTEEQTPKLNFATGFIDLTSLEGMARLFFIDNKVIINNDPNAFVCYENSYIFGFYMAISGDPIWDLYDPDSGGSPFVTEIDSIVGKGLVDGSGNPYQPIVSEFATASIRAPYDLLRSHGKFSTALHLMYQKERERFDHTPVNHPVTIAKPKPVVTPTVKPSQSKPNVSAPRPRPNSRPSRDFEESDEEFATRTIVAPTGKVNAYRDMVNLELNSALGNISLVNTIVSDFYVNPNGSLNLTLNGYNTLRLDRDRTVELKSGDIINVVGPENVIEVANRLEINGSLLFAPNAQLKIRFTDDDANVIFENNTILDLEGKVELIFEGKGSAWLRDGTLINMKGTKTAGATVNGRKEYSYSNLPSLVVRDGAILDSSNGTITVKGAGKFIIRDGGVLDLDLFSYMVIGSRTLDANGKEVASDYIPIEVASNGMIYIHDYGRLSLRDLRSNLNIHKNGIVYVSGDSLLELNAYSDGTLAQGYIDSVVFEPSGQIYVKEGGRLRIAENKDVIQGNKISWNSSDAIIKGSGYVEYLTRNAATGYQYQGFTGKLQSDSSQVLFKSLDDGISAFDLVRTLVNENTALTYSTLLTDASAQKVIRFNDNGRQKVVTTGDTITSDDKAGVYGTTSAATGNRRVVYKSDGERIVT